MFVKKIYEERRYRLKKKLNSGIVLLLGNTESPINNEHEFYKFRQEDNFLYYVGISDRPNLAVLIDVDENKTILYGNNFTVAEQVWIGDQPKIESLAELSGIGETAGIDDLKTKLDNCIKTERIIHFLPTCRTENLIRIEELLGFPYSNVNKNASLDFINTVIEQRSVKSIEEVSQIEHSINISYEMYSHLLREIKPGITENKLVSSIEKILFSYGYKTAFPTILTVNGKTLHNELYTNTLKEGDLLLIDSGVKSDENYCSDITRTYPVSGKYSSKQKDIYNIVLTAQLKAIELIKPGKIFKDIHQEVSKIIAAGLKDIGLIKGSIEEAVKEGAHTLFYPHGTGHMLGLGAHDMAVLATGALDSKGKIKLEREEGMSYIKLTRPLEAGFVITVEPGIYFIPNLIDQWKAEGKCKDFINYDVVEKYRDFEGIRIEDDVLVTSTGSKILGKSIPKTIEEIEKHIK